MTPNLLDELERIVALSEKATPGPWERGSGARNEPATMVYCDDAIGSAVANCHLEYTVAISGDRELGNAALIAAAVNFLRTHAPALADMAKRLEMDAVPVSALEALLPGTYYMDPPDGGDVQVYEQLRRMAKDAARYRWLRMNCLDRWEDKASGEPHGCSFNFEGATHDVDADVDAAIDATQEGEG